MSTPEFVLELRKKIGHDLLWLNGVTGCVLNEHGQLLLGRRSDTGEWAMVYGINEPGEQPADTVVREIKEETGIDAIVTDLVAVTSSNKVLTYANGDNTMYMESYRQTIKICDQEHIFFLFCTLCHTKAFCKINYRNSLSPCAESTFYIRMCIWNWCKCSICKNFTNLSHINTVVISSYYEFQNF